MNAARMNEFESDTIDQAGRDEMVRQHLGLVHHTVERICGPAARSSGAFDDLVSAGMMGLLHSLEAFDPSRGVAFSTYAHPRVRGAVLDELRKLDSVPRSVRRKKRAIGQARDAIRSRGNGRMSDQEVADEMGIDAPTLRAWELDAERGNCESLDASTSQNRSALNCDNESWSAPEVGADVVLERREEVDSVREALARMPEQERLVLILSFYEDLKLRQIGEVLGVSESRVSQIRSTGLARLRRELAAVVA